MPGSAPTQSGRHPRRRQVGARQLPVFSAKYPPAHALGKGPQSLAGAPLRGDAKGQNGYGPSSRTATGSLLALSCLPGAAALGHSRLSAPAWWAPDSTSVYSKAEYDVPIGLRAGPFAGLPTCAAAV